MGRTGYEITGTDSPDVFSVEWNGDHVTVWHYPSRAANAFCCKVEGTIEEADRAGDYGPYIACLLRLKMPCGIDR